MNPELHPWHHHHMWLFSPIHLVVMAVIAWIVWIVPLYRILGRIGVSPFWAFVAIFPPLGLVMLWVIAFSDWKTGGTKDAAGG